jgi:hypothetical protein
MRWVLCIMYFLMVVLHALPPCSAAYGCCVPCLTACRRGWGALEMPHKFAGMTGCHATMTQAAAEGVHVGSSC